jgi:hypothetical protein
MTSRQEELRWDLVTRFHDARDRIYKGLKKAYDSVPFDHILIDTDTKASSLSQGVSREGGRRSHVDVAAYLLVRPECSLQLLTDISAVCDMRPMPRELTAEQKVFCYELELARHGELGEVIKRNALAGGR